MTNSLFLKLTRSLCLPLAIHFNMVFSISLLSVQIQATASAFSSEATQGASQAQQLEPSKPIERELAGGQSHSYRITMISGQYLQVVVEQQGIDVVVALFAPDEKKIIEVDSPNGTAGPEPVSAIAEVTGAYRIEVRSLQKTAQAGRYKIRVEELRVAIAKDKYQVAAGIVFKEATQLEGGTLDAQKKSIEKYYEALELYRRAGDRRMEAETLDSIGWVYHSLGEVQKTLDKFNEALPLRQAVNDRNGEAITLNNLGNIYKSLGEMQKALEKYNESLPIRRAVGNLSGEAITLVNIGVVYELLGELQKSLEKYNEALRINRTVGDRLNEAITLTNIGGVYRLLGEPQKSLEKYNKALPLIRSVNYRKGEALTLNDIGVVYNSLGEWQKALEIYHESLLISREIGNRRGEALTLNNLGVVYNSLGERQKALEIYHEALPLSREVGARREEALALDNIGTVYSSLGEWQQALDKFNEALLIERAVGNRRSESATLLKIARVEQKRGNLAQARQTIEQAIGIIESMRTKIDSQELRASYFASQQEFYGSYLGLLMQMHRQNPNAGFDAEALAVSERARARSLLELLTESRADIRQGVDLALLERERSLQQRLRAKATAQTSLLNHNHTTAQAEALAEEIAAITDEYDEVEARIRKSSPRYAALTQPRPLNLSEIQRQVLDSETLLLEYYLGDEASYLFVVSQTSITSYQLPGRAEIEVATRRVRDLLTAPQPKSGENSAQSLARIKEAEAGYWPQAATLSRLLLGPAASQLGAKRLLIVADGALQYLPFGVLPVPGSQTMPVPLIVEHEIVHLPSASALAVLRRELAGRRSAPKAVAVLADPVFSADDGRVKPDSSDRKAQARVETPPDLTRAIDDVRGKLTRLPMTRDEADAVFSVAPLKTGLKALDFRASRATSTSDELSQYRIVHFATHGLLNSEHPKLSGLVLSLVDEQGRPQDGFLRLHEIFNLRLPAELVVLSACQTGLGKEIKGEGLVGLTRGFMYAGVARVVASLWQVNDAATAELMKRFYRRMLQEGMRPSAALRAAQIEMWKRPHWQSPFYWGAFVLQGEWK
jgi:CHAT domain-containing protein/predicted negative regulator of RcsB-dependent stress response